MKEDSLIMTPSSSAVMLVGQIKKKGRHHLFLNYLGFNIDMQFFFAMTLQMEDC